jgi:fatty acid-binding protein DegV
MPVGIVTDSTSYLPESVVTELGIEVVQLQVISNGIAYNEVDGITAGGTATATAASLTRFSHIGSRNHNQYK